MHHPLCKTNTTFEKNEISDITNLILRVRVHKLQTLLAFGAVIGVKRIDQDFAASLLRLMGALTRSAEQLVHEGLARMQLYIALTVAALVGLFRAMRMLLGNLRVVEVDF